jgi:tRNA(fMet)-specific endonuclease VapC
MRYLLDTNTISDLVRNPQGLTARRIAQVGESAVCTSVIVAADLWYGAAKRASARLTASSRRFSKPPRFCRLSRPPKESTDGFGQASFTLGFTLVTDNEREFSRIAELLRENWVRADRE